MHEASIALSIIDIIVGRCRSEGFQTIDEVTVRIGRAAGIMPDALSFTFDVAKEDTPARGARLIIDSVPVGGACKSCNRDFVVDDTYVLECPLCGSSSFQITQGNEMEITDMEVH
jgi:hydrogenase nickel incorporation protein HypA/HybF